MTDKPQTLAEQIRALEPPRGMGPASIMRSGWNEAIKEAAALADAATPTGWVIANGNNNRWRCVWEWESNVEWTDDITQALKFATRDDAERYSKEDEDAWLIYQVGIPPTTTPVVGAEQAGYVRQAVSDEGPQMLPVRFTCLGCKHLHTEAWEEEGDNDHWDSGVTALCQKANMRIGHYWYEKTAAPDWCPCARITAALEPDPTPALSWRAMQTAAIAAQPVTSANPDETIRDRAYFDGIMAYAKAILALPGPTYADLDREALNRPVVQAMRTALQTLRNLMCEAFEDDDGNSGCGLCENDCTGCIAHFALAKIGGAA